MRHIGESVSECALLAVRIAVGPGQVMEMQAVAALGEWAVTRFIGEPGRFAVTHIPSGFRTGPSLTERDALRTVAKLRSLSVRTAEELAESAQVIVAAHPAYWRKQRGSLPPEPTLVLLPEVHLD